MNSIIAYLLMMLVLWLPLNFRKYEADHRLLMRSQWWSRDELQAFQWAELTKLIRLAASSTPYYQELFRRIGLEPGDVKNWDDFRRIPVLQREDVVQNKERLASATVPRSAPHVLSSAFSATALPVRRFACQDDFWLDAESGRAARVGAHLPSREIVDPR